MSDWEWRRTSWIMRVIFRKPPFVRTRVWGYSGVREVEYSWWPFEGFGDGAG